MITASHSSLEENGFKIVGANGLPFSERDIEQLHTLQTKTFYGKEKKSLAYVIAIMNMILHGIEAPNIVHTNTLTENLADIQEKDRYDVVLANPPFGGKERPEVQQNFPIRTGETAFLFLQHFIKTNVGSVGSTDFFFLANNHGMNHFTFLYESTRSSNFDNTGNHVTNLSITFFIPTKDANTLELFSAGIICYL
jgi:23S rRNA G2445 N2-methylase RlmL